MKTTKMIALLAMTSVVDVASAQEASFKLGASTEKGVNAEADAEGDAPEAETKAEASAPETETSAELETKTAGPEAQSTAAASGEGESVDAPESSGEVEAEPTAKAAPKSEAPSIPYMKRYVPEQGLFEFGIFGGIFVPNANHELYEPGRPETQQPYKPAFQVGVRVGAFPVEMFGLEVEAAGMSSGLKDENSPAGFASLRGFTIFQLPGHSIVPFLSIGGGFLAATSSPMNDDIDPVFSPGLGVKAAIDEYLSLRLDVRNVMHQKFEASQGALTHSPEVLLGLTFTTNRKKPDSDGDGIPDHKDACPHLSGEFDGCPPPDADGDGVVDEQDECPEAAGIEPSGCPDSDGDGIVDPKDACPDVAGNTPGGCFCASEPPAPDADGDGVPDTADQCPEIAANTKDGCPPDADGDGIADDQDQCPKEPETKNGYQDKDGCPDEVPEEVRAFDGTMEGVVFAFDSAELSAESKESLDATAAIMKKYPSITVEISGHTDDSGDHDHNVGLSKERADAVKAYLVEAGVAAGRISTKGYGPDKPVAPNDTPANKAKNRRIEFHLDGH